MGYYDFPHTRNYDSDLGFLIKRVKELTRIVDDFVAVNMIRFADPIEWSDTTRYEPYTIVLGPDGNSYMSKKYVPAGVDVTNTEYWEKISDHNAQLEQLSDLVTEYINNNNQRIISINDQLEDLQNRRYTGIPTAVNQYIGSDVVVTGQINTQFAALEKVANSIYGFYPTNYDNTGVVKRYDLDTNNITLIKSDAYIGHCNSVAFDPRTNFFVVIPISTYVSGTATRYNGLYLFDSAFNQVSSISGNYPKNLYACSYDHKTNKFYAASIWDYFELYELDTDYNVINTINIDMSDVYHDAFDSSQVIPQDFAIYDGVIYLEMTNGLFYTSTLEDRHMTTAFFSERVTSNNVWRLGEPEGITIDDDGLLYQSNVISNSQFKIGIVTCVGIDDRIRTQRNTTYNYTHVTYNLTPDTVNSFCLGQYDLHSLGELPALINDDIHVVQVTGHVTELNYNRSEWLNIVSDITLKVQPNAIYDVGTIQAAGVFAVQVMSYNGDGVLNAASSNNSPFITAQNLMCIISMDVNGKYTQSGMSHTVNTSFSTAPVFIGRLGTAAGSSAITVGNNTATAFSCYMGNNKVFGA